MIWLGWVGLCWVYVISNFVGYLMPNSFLYIQGGTIKLSPKKKRYDSISLQWKPVFFFCCRLSTSWPFVYKSQERWEPSIMSESDTMFNGRDRRCAAVQLMHAIDPSYDNRTIASTLKMQIRIVQRLRGQLNPSDDLLEVVELKDTARKTRTKEFIEKV